MESIFDRLKQAEQFMTEHPTPEMTPRRKLLMQIDATQLRIKDARSRAGMALEEMNALDAQLKDSSLDRVPAIAERMLVLEKMVNLYNFIAGYEEQKAEHYRLQALGEPDDGVREYNGLRDRLSDLKVQLGSLSRVKHPSATEQETLNQIAVEISQIERTLYEKYAFQEAMRLENEAVRRGG